MTNPEALAETNIESIKQHAIIENGKRVLGKAALILSIAVAPATTLFAANMASENIDTAEATIENTYPDGNATDCSATYGVYSWCKGGNWLSSRGYAYRNCTDWAAYRAAQLNGMSVPHNLGNATTWDTNAPSYWAVDTTPEVGDIAQNDTSAGGYGHVGIVEEVNKNQQGQTSSIKVSEYNGSGTGNYSLSNYYPNGSGSFSANWHHFIDLNGTGVGASGDVITGPPPNQKADIVAFEETSSGVGRFMQAASLGNGQFLWGYSNLNGVQTPSHFALGDFNGDGKDDLVDFEPNNGLHVPRFMQGGSMNNGQFNWGFTNLNNISTPDTFDMGDINGDGKDDIVAFQASSSSAGNYMVGVSQGNGQFAWNFTNLSNMTKPKHFAMGDINGDNKADIIAFEQISSTIGRFMTASSNGNNTFNWGVSNLQNVQIPTHFAMGDINGDNKDDLIDFEPNNGLHVARYMQGTSMGNGQFNWGFSNLNDVQEPSHFAMGDINADGKDDIVAFEPNNGLHVSRFMQGTSAGNGQFMWGFSNLNDITSPTVFDVGNFAE